jgi:putative cell wall-binding protein
MASHQPSRRAVAAALVTALVGLSLAIASPASARPSFELDRLAGETRFETASEIALATFSDAPVAILANQASFADPLAAAYLAGAESAPILLTKVSEIPAVTLDTLEALGVAEVILVGGTAVISEAVKSQLEGAGYAVRRLAGDNRYATAQAVAEDPTAANVGSTDDGKTAFLATGQSFPDSLSAAGGAYAGQFPLLLTPPDAIHPATQAALDNLVIEHVVILGGTGAVSAEVETALTDQGKTTERLQGADRFATNVAVAGWLIDTLDFSVTDIDVATGTAFADALTGSAHAGENTRIVVLTGSVPAGTCTFLGTHKDTLLGGAIFGGTAAVDGATEQSLEACGGGSPAKRGIIIEFSTTPGADPNEKSGEYTIIESSTGTRHTFTYDRLNDYFEVDGTPASRQAFESSLDVGDEIAFFNDPDQSNESTDADEHILTNVERTSGMVGNVDISEDTFFIIEPVSGTAISDAFDYSPGSSSFTVGGQTTSEAAFEDNINEGDGISVENGDDFHLTNQVTTGDVTTRSLEANEVVIGNLGDDPTNDQDDSYDWESGADDTDFVVGGASATKEQFEAAVSVPDRLSYTKTNGTQTFSLTNVAPAEKSGTARDGGTLAPNFGTNIVKVANGGTTHEIDYTDTERFLVNGFLVVETEFEAAYSAGDTISFTPDNPDTSADEEKLELKDAALFGHLAEVVVGTVGANDDVEHFDVVNGSGTLIYDNLDYTAAVFGGSDSYQVNGLLAVLATFENAINGADGNDTIRVSGHPDSTAHAFTVV